MAQNHGTGAGTVGLWAGPSASLTRRKDTAKADKEASEALQSHPVPSSALQYYYTNIDAEEPVGLWRWSAAICQNPVRKATNQGNNNGYIICREVITNLAVPRNTPLWVGRFLLCLRSVLRTRTLHIENSFSLLP